MQHNMQRQHSKYVRQQHSMWPPSWSVTVEAATRGGMQGTSHSNKHNDAGNCRNGAAAEPLPVRQPCHDMGPV